MRRPRSCAATLLRPRLPHSETSTRTLCECDTGGRSGLACGARCCAAIRIPVFGDGING